MGSEQLLSELELEPQPKTKEVVSRIEITKIPVAGSKPKTVRTPVKQRTAPEETPVLPPVKPVPVNTTSRIGKNSVFDKKVIKDQTIVDEDDFNELAAVQSNMFVRRSMTRSINSTKSAANLTVSQSDILLIFKKRRWLTSIQILT